MQQWIATGVMAVLTLVLLVLLVRERARTGRELSAAHAEAASLRAQVDEIERRLATPPAPASPHRPQTEFVITHLGDRPEPVADDAPAPLDRALFADLVLRESVVKAGSLAHGLRRALAPETRHRIRSEVRRQTRAARKQRRRELRDLARRRRSADPTADAA
ncbi:hypothetical protein [Nocardioides panaciterrulae]|uniref:Uncharacterized protein n=1 Tax=Nocardioides panaciterrulae TaxID=661492 RepID=A0A7Y9E6V1_9ACTN|nr:hypothetical protein [Nocardioides panaciterrulae]NYD42087.1 hypothetical protein [Nocardioides panaciterrulae]